MTNEEALEILTDKWVFTSACEYSDFEQGKALEMAIDALSFDLDKYLKEHFLVAMDKDVAEDALQALKEKQECEERRKKNTEDVCDAEIQGILRKNGEVNRMTNSEAIKRLKVMHLGLSADKKEACDIAIKALESQRWIPCSERLPEKLKEVVIAFGDGSEYDVAFLRKSFNKDYTDNGADNEWYSVMGNTTYADYEVEAWMPLQPYKEGEE